MKLIQRQSLLASLLIKQNGFQTVKYYANKLNISERTVHSDLKVVEEYLTQEGYRIEKRPGLGISIKRSVEIPQKIAEVLEKNIYSTAGRREKIIQLLLFENQTVTFELLSEMFLISRSSINNDLKFIKHLLTTGNTIKIISDSKGTRISGPEKELQKAYLEFNHYLTERKNNLFEPDDEKKEALLAQYYGKDIVSVCTRVLYGYIKRDVTVIAEHYVSNVLNMMIILVYRVSSGHHVEGVEKPENKNECVFFKKSAQEMLNKISLRLNLQFTRNDIEYLSTYLISNRFEPLPTKEQYHEVVSNIIEKVSSSLKINFTEDRKLKDQLILHIPPMIYRLREGVQTNNPFLYQIKNEFTVMFNSIWVILSEYEEELEVTFNEDEIGFLTIYFQSAIERAKLSKKILIVCPTGIATSELLLNRIKNILPSFDMIEVASIKEVDVLDLEQIDFIISTVPLNRLNRKTVIVSPLLSDQDIKNITMAYNEQFLFLKAFEEDELKQLSNLAPYLSEEFIFWNENFKTKDELLKEIGKRLKEAYVVTEKFVESMMNRERLGGTDLPTGAAIPHGNPKYVKKTVIAVVKNEKYIKWNEHSVKIVMIVCIAEKNIQEIKGILSDIYQIVESKDRMKQFTEFSIKEVLRQKIGCETLEE
ncbi:BglG family transcription antiterminator [Enterococcus crotali]